MSSSINNFISPFYTSIIGNDNNESELQAEIDDLKEDLANNYYNKIESDQRYLNQENKSKWGENVIGNTIYNKNNKKVAINKLTADTDLDVSGMLQTKDIKITSGLIAQGTKGVANQILKTDGTNVYWANDSGGGQGSSKWVSNNDVIYPENNKKVVVGETTIDDGFVFQTLGDVKIKGDISTNKINNTFISSDNNYNLFLATTPQVGIGSDNILIGNNTASNFQSNNTKNIIIGVNTDLEYNANNRLNIGDVIFGSDLYTSNGKVGINKYIPEENLDISGNIKLNGGIKIDNSFGNLGQVLTSNGQGKVIWSDISSSSTDSKWSQAGDTISNNTSSIVDISGDLKINEQNFTKTVLINSQQNTAPNQTTKSVSGTNIAGTQNITLGTISIPNNFASSQSFQIHMSGTAMGSGGYGSAIQGGIRIYDNINNLLIQYAIGSDVNAQGKFNKNNTFTITNLSNSSYPLKINGYATFVGEFIDDISSTIIFNYNEFIPIKKYNIEVDDLLKTDISNDLVEISGNLKTTFLVDKNSMKGNVGQVLTSSSNGLEWRDISDNSKWIQTNSKIVNKSDISAVEISGSLISNNIIMKNYKVRADQNNNLIIDLSNQEFLKLEESIQPFEETISGQSQTIGFIEKTAMSASTYSNYMNTPANFPPGVQTIYITLKTTGAVSNCYYTNPTDPNSLVCSLPIPKIPNAMYFEVLDGSLQLLCRQILTGDDYNSNISYSPFSIEHTFAIDISAATFPYVLRYQKPNTQISLETAQTTFTIRYYSEEPVKMMTLSGDMYANNFYGLIHPASLQESMINCENVKVGKNTIYLDGLNNKIGVSTSTPQACLDISQNIVNAMKIGNCLFVDSSNNIVSVNGDISANNVYNKTQIDLSFAQVNNTVLLTNNQTIGGIKTFSSPIIADVSGSITRSNNISGGLAGSIPYQSGVNITSFTNVGSPGQILQSNGTSAPSWVAPNTVPNTTVTTSSDATNAGRFVAFKSALSGSLADLTNNNFQYNPSTNRLSAGTFVGNLDGTASNSTNASAVMSSLDTANAGRFIPFKNQSLLPGNAPDLYNSQLQYNPSTNVLTAGTFNGNVTGNVTGNLTGTASSIQLRSGLTPTSSGSPGQIGYDGNYIYICIATNTWKRVLISSW